MPGARGGPRAAGRGRDGASSCMHGAALRIAPGRHPRLAARDRRRPRGDAQLRLGGAARDRRRTAAALGVQPDRRAAAPRLASRDGRWLRFPALPRCGRWGCGAVGSALAWHARGQGFESPQLHSRRRQANNSAPTATSSSDVVVSSPSGPPRPLRSAPAPLGVHRRCGALGLAVPPRDAAGVVADLGLVRATFVAAAVAFTGRSPCAAPCPAKRPQQCLECCCAASAARVGW